MVVDATGSGMYLPLSLLYFHHNTGLSITRVGAIISAPGRVLGLVSKPDHRRPGGTGTAPGPSWSAGYLVRATAFASYRAGARPGAVVPGRAGVMAIGDVSFSPSIQSFIAEIAEGAARDRLIACPAQPAQRGGSARAACSPGARLALGQRDRPTTGSCWAARWRFAVAGPADPLDTHPARAPRRSPAPPAATGWWHATVRSWP
ncbi:hypothetical protein [Actinoplanes nipponensis]|uniref:hypothetical protein n=1 Tax=Actinoplanes nipponensis TaxID=135950 RepID=UPI0031E6017E